MIKRIYDKFNFRCYIKVKCDTCGFTATEIDGYGLASKDFLEELVGWKRYDNGKVICCSCQEKKDMEKDNEYSNS